MYEQLLYHVMASPAIHSSVVKSSSALVRPFGDEHPAMRVSKATLLRLLGRADAWPGARGHLATDVAT